MINFVKFYFYNSYTQLAFFVFTVGFLISLNSTTHSQMLFNYALSGSFLLLFIGIITNILLFSNKKLIAYKNLTQLLIITKKIEALFDELGAEGRGMYEKAEDLRLSNDILQKLLYIAEIRNNAMHGNPHIENINTVLKESKKIYKEVHRLIKLQDEISFWSARFIMYGIVFYFGYYIYQISHISLALLSIIFSYTINNYLLSIVSEKIYLVLITIIALLIFLIQKGVL